MPRKNRTRDQQVRPCEWCTQPFRKPGRPAARFCSQACACKAVGVARRGLGLVERQVCACVLCGDAFKRTPHRKQFCSRECTAIYAAAVRSARVLAARAAAPRRRIVHTWSGRTRARHRGNPVAPLVRDLDVLRRDKWRCRLCGVSTPRRLRGTKHVRAPEVDHIVPIAMGGAHSMDNLQCACRVCNYRKGATWRGQRGLPFDV